MTARLFDYPFEDLRHPSHSIIDSTKIKNYMACPRKYFFEYVLGWRPMTGSIHLEFGKAMHVAMEELARGRIREGRMHYTDEDAARGVMEFSKIFNSYLENSGKSEDECDPKNTQGMMHMLAVYIDTYQRENYMPLHVEISGSVPIGTTPDGEDKRIFFRLDEIGVNEKGDHLVVDHKTASQDSASWDAQWRVNTQMGTYTHLLHSIYGDKVDCVVVNGLIFRKNTKTGKGCGVKRLPIHLEKLAMQSWLENVQFHYDEIMRNTELFFSDQDKPNVMRAFPQRETACTDYGSVCPYIQYCEYYANPIRHIDPLLPDTHFQRSFWDPRDLDTNTTTKVTV